MKPEHPDKIMQGFAGTFKGLRLYPIRHPAVERQLQAFLNGLQELLTRSGTVRMGVVDGTLFLQDHLFVETGPAAQEIQSLLDARELKELEIKPGIDLEELRAFIEILAEGKLKGETLRTTLKTRNIRHLRIITQESAEEEREIKAAESPRNVYGRALKVVDTIFQDVRMGRIPSSEEALGVVQSMARLTLAEPHALFALSMLKDYDNYTFTHSVNVSVIGLAVGRACGLDENQLRLLGLGGLLHDVGKLKIEHSIIAKPGPLSDREFDEIKKHPLTGADLVAEMEGVTREVVDIVLGHHLRYDRQGYPEDARGKSISPLADMAAIADTYDAITTLRSYQRPMTPRKAIARLQELSGTALHPEHLEHFITSLGTYPVGSLVRLSSSEIGLVVWVDTRNPDRIRLKILFDTEGNRLDDPGERELSDSADGRIVCELDPFLKGIEVTEFFA